MPLGWIFARIIRTQRSTKVAKTLVVRWPFYGKVKFASLCICMGKIFKKSSPKPSIPCGWIFAYVIRNGRATKVANGRTLTFDLFTVRSILLPYAFVWEKCSEFQTTSPLEPLCQFCSNFIWSLLRLGERKIAKMVTVRWPRWPPCPYMVKTFKSLLLQNRGCFGAESLHKSSGTGGLPKLLK